MWLWGERIPEEDEHIDLSRCDLGSNLLISTQGSALKFVYFNSEFLFQKCARRSCRVEVVLLEQHLIKAGPFQQILFFLIVCDEGYLFLSTHFSSFLVSLTA